MNTVQFDVELDVRQLRCPMPILRTKRELAQLASGQVLKVMATDPEASKDFDVFCRQTGNQLLSSEQNDEVMVFYIRRK